MLRTGDNKMLLHSDSGDLALFDPNPAEYRELSRANVCGPTWAHPAAARKRAARVIAGHCRFIIDLRIWVGLPIPYRSATGNTGTMSPIL